MDCRSANFCTLTRPELKNTITAFTGIKNGDSGCKFLEADPGESSPLPTPRKFVNDEENDS